MEEKKKNSLNLSMQNCLKDELTEVSGGLWKGIDVKVDKSTMDQNMNINAIASGTNSFVQMTGNINQNQSK